MPTSQRKLVQTSLMSIRWGDMDAYGHVNNTVYFRYMEQCRVEYLETLGFKVLPRGTAPVIINAACTFLVPLNYPGIVEVRMFCAHPGRSSVQTHYEIRLQDKEPSTPPAIPRSSGWTWPPASRCRFPRSGAHSCRNHLALFARFVLPLRSSTMQQGGGEWISRLSGAQAPNVSPAPGSALSWLPSIAAGMPLARLSQPLALVGGRAGGVLDVGLGRVRSARRARRAHSRRRQAHAWRALVPASAAQLRAESAAQRRRRSRLRPTPTPWSSGAKTRSSGVSRTPSCTRKSRAARRPCRRPASVAAIASPPTCRTCRKP
jgi:acyl-CoA thioester hydrolase